MEERHGRSIPSPVSRVITACVFLFGVWLLLAQVAPRMMGTNLLPAALQPPRPSSSPPAAAPAIPAAAPPAPEKPAAPAAPASEPVQLKPIKPENAMPEAKPEDAAKAAAQGTSLEALQALEAKMDAQAKAIEALQHQQAQAMHTIALLDACGRLETRVLAGRPYADELAQLRALAAENASLAAPLNALEANAGKGIPPLDVLQHDFSHSIRAVLHPALPEDAGFFARFMANLSQSISIRRVGDVPGNSTQAIIARAENALAHNDVPRAISELAALPAPAAQAMRPWVEEATVYAKRDDALAALKSAIMAQNAPSP